VWGAPRKIISALAIATPLLVLAQVLASCGDDGDGTVCNPGDEKDCNGAGQCSGEQVCNADGSGYGDCDCSVGGGSGGSANGSSGAGGGSNLAGSGGGVSAGPLVSLGVGTPCTTDTQCPTGENGEAPLRCILAASNAEFGGGGPQGGYCSAACTSTDECQLIDDRAGCGLIDMATGSGYCIAICGPGNGGLKCGGDRAQACYQRDATNAMAGGLCLPRCLSDADCGAGRFCDPGDIGLCLDAAPAGGGVGAPCAEATEATDCASGICLTFRNPDDPNGPSPGSFCTASCTFLRRDGCGQPAGSTTAPDAACLQPRFAGGAGGDLGFCVELCDVSADCAQTADDWVCDPFDAALAMEVGRVGECIPAALLAEPPDAGTD
jgi:hypothetical protein